MQAAALLFSAVPPATLPPDTGDDPAAGDSGFAALMEDHPKPSPAEGAEATAPHGDRSEETIEGESPPAPAAFWTVALEVSKLAPLAPEAVAEPVGTELTTPVPAGAVAAEPMVVAPMIAAPSEPIVAFALPRADAEAQAAETTLTSLPTSPEPTPVEAQIVSDSADSYTASTAAPHSNVAQEGEVPPPLPAASAMEAVSGAPTHAPLSPMPAAGPAEPVSAPEPIEARVPAFWLLRLTQPPEPVAEPDAALAADGAAAALLAAAPVAPDAADPVLALPPPLASVQAAPAQPAAPSPAALPPALAPQIAAGLPAHPGAAVELRLSPAELGRVRLRLSQDGEALRVAIQVERPETLDLLRRHADLLLAEIRSAGFAGGTLSFGGWSGGGNGNDLPTAPGAPPERQTGPGPAEALPAPMPNASGGTAPGTLNLRL